MGWWLDSCFNLHCTPADRYLAETRYCFKDKFAVNCNAEIVELNMQRELHKAHMPAEARESPVLS
jgi:hypothetical protein